MSLLHRAPTELYISFKTLNSMSLLQRAPNELYIYFCYIALLYTCLETV